MLWPSLLVLEKKKKREDKEGRGGISVDLLIVLSSLQRYARPETREPISIIEPGSSGGKDVRTSVPMFPSFVKSLDLFEKHRRNRVSGRKSTVA